MKPIICMVAASLLLAACSTTPPSPQPSAPASAPAANASILEDYERSLQDAVTQGSDPAKASAVLKERVADPRFLRLPAGRQYKWRHLEALLAVQTGDCDYAYAAALQTTAMPDADKDDWSIRFFCAVSKHDRKDAIESVQTIARRWPKALGELDDRYLQRFVRDVVKSAPSAESRGLLDALFASEWTLKGGLQPSPLWSELVRLRMEQQDVTGAAQVAARIMQARVLLGMRVDKRFDPLVRAAPDSFDVPTAIERELANLRQLSAASPRDLGLKVEQISTLVDAGRYDQALALADQLLANSRTAEDAAALYDDADEQFNWILDYRAQALQGLAVWYEAEKYLRDAASRLENGHPNVSNAINLAFFYASLGRSRDAIAALGPMATSSDEVSPYGEMQVQRVLLRVALTNKDSNATRAALDHMRKRQSASPATFEDALLDADRLDEAASLLISRLKDPLLRRDALLDVQDYQKFVPLPANRVLQERWRTLRARADVQAAVAEVGRIESVPLAPAMQ